MKTDNTTTLTERTQGSLEKYVKNGNFHISEFGAVYHQRRYFKMIKTDKVTTINTKVLINVFGETTEDAETNAAFICKAVNNYDSLLNALKEITNRFEVVAADAGGYLDEHDISLIKQSKETIKKAEQ